MGDAHRKSELLQLGICESCFCFQGIQVIPDPAITHSTIPIQFPICSSTQSPLIGYCNKSIPKQSRASQGIKSQSKSKSKSSSKSKKVMVWIGDKQFEQGHFNDYLKQLKSESKGQ